MTLVALALDLTAPAAARGTDDVDQTGGAEVKTHAHASALRTAGSARIVDSCFLVYSLVDSSDPC